MEVLTVADGVAVAAESVVCSRFLTPPFHEQQCQEQTRTVCDQVPTTTCQLVAFTDCRMVMEEVPYTETEVITEGQYVPWQCSNFTREEIHQKLVGSSSSLSTV